MMQSGFFKGSDGTRLYFEAHGSPDNPAMVITDGLGCNGVFFEEMIEYFKKDLYVVIWNYRGHGKSEIPKDKSHITIDYAVEDINMLMRHLGIKKAIHVGFSVGVQVVIEFVLKHPRKVSALILIAGTAGRVLDTFHNNSLMKSAFPLLYYFVLNNKNVIHKYIKELLPTRFAYFVASLTEIDGRLINQEVFQRYLNHLATMDMEVFARLLASAAEHDAWDRISKIRKPTLIICGTKDTFTPIHLSERMYELIKGSQLLRVRGATHSLLAEQPDLINLRIEKFLKEKGFITSQPTK